MIEHPRVGLLRLAHQRFDVRGAARLELELLTATAGSQSAVAEVADEGSAVSVARVPGTPEVTAFLTGRTRSTLSP